MLPVSKKCLLWMIHRIIVWIKTFCVSGWLLFLCLPHLDQYYQCSSHLAPPPARTARDPNMTAQCSPPPSQHLQYLLTLDMQLISLLYHWLFTSLHIFAWGLEKHKALFALIHFAKFTNYLWLVINFIWQKGFVSSELITSSHINKYWWVRR